MFTKQKIPKIIFNLILKAYFDNTIRPHDFFMVNFERESHLVDLININDNLDTVQRDQLRYSLHKIKFKYNEIYIYQMNYWDEYITIDNPPLLNIDNRDSFFSYVGKYRDFLHSNKFNSIKDIYCFNCSLVKNDSIFAELVINETKFISKEEFQYLLPTITKIPSS
jgi:hypothetical protein